MVDGLTVPHQERVTDCHIDTNGLGGISLDAIQNWAFDLFRRPVFGRSDMLTAALALGELFKCERTQISRPFVPSKFTQRRNGRREGLKRWSGSPRS